MGYYEKQIYSKPQYICCEYIFNLFLQHERAGQSLNFFLLVCQALLFTVFYVTT